MAKKKITFLKDEKGSEDGFSVLKFVKGQTYEVEAELADVFLDELKSAELADPKAKAVENKKTDGDPAPPKQEKKRD